MHHPVGANTVRPYTSASNETTPVGTVGDDGPHKLRNCTKRTVLPGRSYKGSPISGEPFLFPNAHQNAQIHIAISVNV